MANKKSTGAAAPEVNNPVVDAATTPVIDPIAAKLAELGVTDEGVIAAVKDLGITSVEDFADADKSDLVSAGLKPVQANKLIKGATVVASAALAAGGATAATADATNVGGGAWLEEVPADVDSISGLLKTRGTLFVTPLAVAYAVRAAVVPEGFWESQQKYADYVEKYLRKRGKKAPAGYFAGPRKQLLRSVHADLIAAIGETADSNYVGKTRRDVFVSAVRSDLLPSLRSFYDKLVIWRNEYRGELQDNMLLGFAAGAAGGSLADIIDEPSTQMLRASLEDLAEAINSVMAYDGEIIAVAAGGQATYIAQLLRDEQYYALAGVTDLDVLKDELGIKANSLTDLTEKSLVKFAYNCALLSGNGNLQRNTINSLITLGKEIDWSSLSATRSGLSSIGGSNLPL